MASRLCAADSRSCTARRNRGQWAHRAETGGKIEKTSHTPL